MGNKNYSPDYLGFYQNFEKRKIRSDTFGKCTILENRFQNQFYIEKIYHIVNHDKDTIFLQRLKDYQEIDSPFIPQIKYYHE